VELTTLCKETANMQKALQDQFSLAMETLEIRIIKGTQTMVNKLSKTLEKAVENMNAQAAQSANFLQAFKAQANRFTAHANRMYDHNPETNMMNMTPASTPTRHKKI
jgi:hypothetical protein